MIKILNIFIIYFHLNVQILQNCSKIKQRYLYKDKIMENFIDIQDNFLCFKQEMIDRMHCHLIHSYDLFRLNQNENCQILKLKATNNEYQEKENQKNEYLIVLKNILNKKKNSLNKKTIYPNIFATKQNKFCSNMGQITHQKNNDNKDDKKDIDILSYSYNFNYWRKCKNSEQKGWNNILLKDLYIYPKYISLKEELLNNDIFIFNIEFLDYKYFEAKQQQKQLCVKNKKYLLMIILFIIVYMIRII